MMKLLSLAKCFYILICLVNCQLFQVCWSRLQDTSGSKGGHVYWQKVPMDWQYLYSWEVASRGSGFYQDEAVGFVSDLCGFLYTYSGNLSNIRDILCSSRTVVIRRDYLHYIKKYNRYEKRHKNLSAHVSPALTVKEGDMVVVGQCR